MGIAPPIKAAAGRPRHVVITGASSGIGAALALAYARQGARLSLLARDTGRLEAVAEKCRALGSEVGTHLADVTDSAGMQRCLAACDEDGDTDLVIANAGIGGGASLATDSGEDRAIAEKVFLTNTLGVMNTIAPLLPRLIARRHGHIVIIGSLAGYLGLPDAPSYSASKAAIRIYGHGLRRLVSASGVRVTVVCPGFVETPMSASLKQRKPFSWTAERTAEHILRAVARGKREVAFPFPLVLAIRLGAILPSPLADYILTRLRRGNLKGFSG